MQGFRSSTAKCVSAASACLGLLALRRSRRIGPRDGGGGGGGEIFGAPNAAGAGIGAGGMREGNEAGDGRYRERPSDAADMGVTVFNGDPTPPRRVLSSFKVFAAVGGGGGGGDGGGGGEVEAFGASWLGREGCEVVPRTGMSVAGFLIMQLSKGPSFFLVAGRGTPEIALEPVASAPRCSAAPMSRNLCRRFPRLSSLWSSSPSSSSSPSKV